MLNSKIGFKLTFGAVLSILVVIGVFAYFNIQSENKSLLMEVERHATQFSEHLKSDMGYDMLHNDRARIQESISRIGNQGAVDGIRVFNKEGEVIYSSIPKEIGKMVSMEATSCYRCHLTGEPMKSLQKQEHMRIFRPVPDGPRFWVLSTRFTMNRRAGQQPVMSTPIRRPCSGYWMSPCLSPKSTRTSAAARWRSSFWPSVPSLS